jgi:HEAT repeat protein
MRFTPAALCVCSLLVAGCTRSTPANDEVSVTPDKPAAVVQKPVAVVAAEVPLGEDENGKAVFAPALDAIKSSLKSADPGVRRTALRSLAKVRWKPPEPAATALTLALADADPELRLEALGIAAAAPFRGGDMAKLLHDPDGRVRIAAAGALLGRDEHETAAFAVLTTILKNRQAAERRAVLELIRAQALVSRPAVPTLVALALDPKDPLRVEAIAVLAQLGSSQEAVDALLLTAYDAEPKARAAALRALGRLDPASAKVQVTLVTALRDPNVEIARAAAEGAGRDAVPELIDLLRHGDERLRDTSVRALGRIGPDACTAVPELTRLAQSDPAERVRQSARAALKTIAPAL